MAPRQLGILTTTTNYYRNYKEPNELPITGSSSLFDLKLKFFSPHSQ